MPLYVVATPIGNDHDLSPRAKETLARCTTVIGEEFREASTLLKKHDIKDKKLEQLNEHSTPEDVQRLCDLCQEQEVALISDCGTPGFCDPGADLVAACRKRGIVIRSLPGPASLTTFLSLAGQRLDEFIFRGFLPANREERQRELKKLKAEPRAVILMDTPYRLTRLLEELSANLPDRNLTVGLDLSTEQENVVTGTASEVEKNLRGKKAEFILLVQARHSVGASLSSMRPKKK